MRLFLVRHGETVDNVAGLYAGIRDSPLTTHGVLQARRLASHFASRSCSIGPVTHIFSSDLQRAVSTAQAIVDAQVTKATEKEDTDHSKLQLVQVVELRERDFRSAEGKRFGTPHPDAETHDEMRARATDFVQAHLDPLLDSISNGDNCKTNTSVVVIAHGLILNSLLRSLLARYAPEEMTRLAKLSSGSVAGRSDFLAAWSNTGYLEMKVDAIASSEETEKSTVQLTVVRVNVLDHLHGLKRTRGGIGSAQFDSKQKTMDSFFKPAAKKRRVD
ncbi:histidine phosphatase superfamily [Neurospora hispaniola]|uniref:Histidine phosphatase superfamily n=1 Tax=Neurospora hispaniola TaxID=588809 RepID=A0AAJ0MR14_9PEZI|nr:histidine phosphatase superfamily [Neurospora hispaniola]